MKLIILEPGITGFDGHFFNYVSAIGKAAALRGVGVHVVGPIGMDREVRRALEATGMEVTEEYQTLPFQSVRARIVKWPLFSIDFGRVLRQQLRMQPQGSLFCAMSGRLDYIAGAIFALRTMPESSMIMQMFYWQGREEGSLAKRGLTFFRKATEYALQRKWDAGRVLLAGQTDIIATNLATRLLRPIPALPLIIDWSLFGEAELSTRVLEEITLGFAGPIRRGKGFEQFVEAIESVRNPYQANVHVRDLQESTEIKVWIERLRNNSRCNLFEGALSSEAYAAFLKSLDIVVLPYDPAEYRCRTSGVFAEAIGLGKIVVAPAQTWMGDILAEHEL
ncbi:MAG: hypothetical protein ACNA8W_05705, partial [Bradymonadaceae bacterium]